MEPVVAQARSPLIQEDGLLYQRLVVDQVTGIDNVKYDVLIIAAIDEGTQYIPFVLTLDIILEFLSFFTNLLLQVLSIS